MNTRYANDWWLQQARENGFKTEKDLWIEASKDYSTVEMASWFQVTSRTIMNRMDRHGIKRNPTWRSASRIRQREWDAKALSLGFNSECDMWGCLLDKYKTAYVVAKEMKLVDSTVRERMRIYGLVRQNIPRQKGEIE
ncbi:MAG: hypothetical protein GY718_10005 [Lentisphaerae bacterium]|nr:hypothetical protein [Lentisphaerota bacterium]